MKIITYQSALLLQTGLLNPKPFFHLCSGWLVQHHAATVLQKMPKFSMRKRFYKTRFMRHITLICSSKRNILTPFFKFLMSAFFNVICDQRIWWNMSRHIWREKSRSEREQPQTDKRQSQLKACDQPTTKTLQLFSISLRACCPKFCAVLSCRQQWQAVHVALIFRPNRQCYLYSSLELYSSLTVNGSKPQNQEMFLDCV